MIIYITVFTTIDNRSGCLLSYNCDSAVEQYFKTKKYHENVYIVVVNIERVTAVKCIPFAVNNTHVLIPSK